MTISLTPWPGKRTSGKLWGNIGFGFYFLLYLSNTVSGRNVWRIVEEDKPGTYVGNLGQFTPNFGNYDLVSSSKNFVYDKATGNVNTAQIIDRDVLSEVCVNGSLLERIEFASTKKGDDNIYVEVFVDDINDNGPQFASDSHTILIPEEVSIGYKFSIPSAQDKDCGNNGTLKYRMRNVSDFKITSSTNQDLLEISTVQPLDRETIEFYSLTIQACDYGTPSRCNSTILEIRVNDFNDNKPMFHNIKSEVNVEENCNSGSKVILALNVSDEDTGRNGQFTISVATVSSKYSGLFYITSFNKLVSTKCLIYDKNAPYIDLVVNAVDHGIPVQNNDVTIRIAIIDINNNSPVLSKVFMNSITENTLPPFVGMIEATDLDENENANVTLKIIAGNKNEDFYFSKLLVLGNLFYLKLRRSLDREEVSVYHLTVEGSDHGTPPLKSFINMTIPILDQNDNHPNCSFVKETVFIPESVPVGTFIAVVQGFDKDEGENSDIKYHFADESESTMFRIIKSSGLITTRMFLDYEVQNKIALKINVEDNGNPKLLSSCLLTINIIDVNDNKPLFTNTTFYFNVPENVVVNSVVGNLSAYDADAGLNSKLIFTILYPSLLVQNTFYLNRDTGEILTRTSLDRESCEFYQFQVLAQDNGDPILSSTAMVELHILDVNDNHPTFYPENYYVNIHSSSQSNGHIAKVTALDFDENDVVLYEIVAKHPKHLLVNVNQTTGVVTYNDSSQLGANDVFSINLIAKDCEEHASNISMLYFTVITHKDDLPQFSMGLYCFTVKENAEHGRYVGQVKATCKNDVIILYSIYRGDPDGIFSINKNGEIRTFGDVDREKKGLFYLQIMARSLGKKNLTGMTSVQIYIEDLNDNPPEFQYTEKLIKVQSSAPVGSKVHKVKALDADSGRGGIVKYEMFHETFTVFANGDIIVASDLSCVSNYSSIITIVASDFGLPQLSSLQNLSINVINENHRSPFIHKNFGVISLLRNVPVNELFLNMTASDPNCDSGTGGGSEVYFNLFGTSNATEFFGIFPEGNLYVKQSLSLTSQSDFSLQVVATYRGNPSLNTSSFVHISVLSATHHHQLFVRDVFRFNVYENEPVGTVAGKLELADKIQNVEVKLVQEYQYFSIDSMTNEIKTKQNIDREQFKVTTGGNNYILFAEAVYKDINGLDIVDLAKIFIEVKDRNDNVPRFSQASYSVAIEENTRVGTVILKLITYDQDEGKNAMVNFSIVSSSLPNATMVNEDGKVLLSKQMENKQIFNFNFSVQVRNRVPPYYNSSCLVEVNVQDANNNKPRFDELLTLKNITENFPIGHVIYQANASDIDYGRNSRLTYTIISGNQESKFEIDRESGKVALIRELDFEEIQSYVLTICAKDSGISPLSSTKILIVNVSDVNDNAPHFEDCSSGITLRETAPVGSKIMQCSAVDNDIGYNGIVTYSISRNEPTGEYFRISDNGTLYVNKRLDRERFPVYMLDITAEDSSVPETTRLMALKTIVIKLEDVNDNSPKFTSPPAVYFKESASTGDYVTTLRASDPDLGLNGRFTFSKGSDNDANLFTVESNGRVTFANIPSGKIVYRLNVVVSDAGDIQKKSEQALSIFMYKEAGLSFLQSEYSAIIVENEPEGAFVISVNAVSTIPADNRSIYYFMTNDSSGGLLTLNSTTGVVSIKDQIDREGEHGEFVKLVIVAVVAGRNALKSASVNVYLSILDINDNIPTFTEYSYTCDVYENIAIGSNILAVQAHDQDKGQNGSVVYEIVNGNKKGVFHIEKKTGRISVARELDSEKQSAYTLNVTASDIGKPSLSSWTVVSINILDVNDNVPTFRRQNYSFTVAENCDVGTTIGQTIALDQDSGENGTIRYSLTGYDASVLSVDAKTGTLRTAVSFDRENIDFYLLKVLARDNGSPMALSSTAWVYLSILDENDNSPKFRSNLSQHAIVPENSPPGTPVIAVEASDRDAGLNSALVYSITRGNDNQEFRISKQGTLLTSSFLDREKIAHYSLQITVADSAIIPSQRHMSSTMVIVDVGDINDHTPYFISDNVIHVREDQPLAKSFASVAATDKDSGLNGKVLYELHGYFAKMLFQIDRYCGELSLRQKLDREELETGHINITVVARDSGKPPNLSQQDIQIIVDDVNDNTPVFQPHLEFVHVFENISIGRELLHITAVDKDQGLNGRVEYDITSGNFNNTFYIHPLDGTIILLEPLDRETFNNYQIDIKAFDFGSPPKQNFTTVQIYVLDANDNEPHFIASPLSKDIKENIPFVENFAQFVAVDEDEGNNSKIVYSVVYPEKYSFLSINNRTGVISLVEPLDREVHSSYSVIIEARDNGNPPLYTQTKFGIYVKDENDNSPLFVDPQRKTNILEGSPVGSQLCVMNATDADVGANADILYTLLNNFGRFRIDSSTGKIFTTAELDRELHGSKFTLTVIAADKGNPSRVTSVSFIVRIFDIDDNRAVFRQNTYLAYLPVRAISGTLVTVVSAVDKDEGLHGKVIYEIKGGSNEFFVEPDNGHVFTQRILSSATYTLKIHALNAESGKRQDTTTLNVETTTKHFPSFDIPVTVYNISEDAKFGDFILNVKASDNPSLQIVSGDPDKQFLLDIVSKNLTLNKNLDYENKHFYNIWLKASLNTIYSVYVNIQIFVIDTNDNRPVFEKSFYEVAVMENDSKNVSVTCIIAEDPDSGVFGLLEYMIVEASARNWFRIDRHTGCIYTTRSIDREHSLNFDFTIQAQDHGLPPCGNNVSVHVNILDRNDNPPILKKLSPLYISEDKLPTLFVATVFATDQDETSNLLYYLQPNDTFSINSETGEIYLVQTLDRETVERYSLTVSVFDGKFVDSTPWNVIVQDIDDNPPRFLQSFYHVEYIELQPVESTVVKLNISDKDIGQNTDVVYFFKRTQTSELFRINSKGLITAAARLFFVKPWKNSDGTNQYNLTVYAQNPNHPSAKPTTTITVEVTDANDHYPIFDIIEYYRYIPNVSRKGTRVVTVRAVDNYDVGLNSEMSYYAIGGNGTGLFCVETSTGHVLVDADVSSKSDKLFLLELQARDLGSPVQISPIHAKVFIMVTVENQHPPQFVQKVYTKDLPENYDIGKEFLRVFATDGDSGINGKVRYRLLPGRQEKYFNIDSVTGSITIASVKLDYEYLTEYSFDVQAEDSAQNQRTDQATVIISVLDYNDNLPEFRKSVYNVNVFENNQIDSEIVVVSATDRDTVGDTITYTLAEKDKKFFEIDSSSGKITTNTVFDYESRGVFNITVLAKDSGQPQKTSDCTVHVVIEGINEFSPVFKNKEYSFSVLEDVVVGTVVSRVSAFDMDSGLDGVVEFMLVDPSSRHTNFDVDEFTGNIYVCGRLDFETVNLVQLTVIVKNPAERILNADNTDVSYITVRIQDTDDPPRFLKDFLKVSVPENVAVGTVLGKFTAVDEDNNQDFMSDFKYTIWSGNVNNTFAFETIGVSVVVKVNKHLDREHMAAFNLTLAATVVNRPHLQGFGHLVIEVDDINDNPPYLLPGICPGHVQENLPKETVVLRFDASDKDVDPNKEPYTFEITNEEYVPFFVDKFSSELRTSKSLDREKVPFYVLRIKIFDGGYPKLFSTTSCSVIVDDVNDNRPSGDTLHVTINVPFSGYFGGVISNVSPLDLDAIDEFTCKIEGSHKDIFQFQPHSCILKMKKPIVVNYILNIMAQDSRHHVSYSVNISFNRISATSSERSVVLRLSGISPENFLSVMDYLPCLPGYEKQIYSVQNVSSTVTDVLIAHLKDSVYISREKLSQILTTCKSSLEGKLGAKIMDTNYDICFSSNPCVHGLCDRHVNVSPEKRTSLHSGTEIFLSAYHNSTFICICNSGYTGDYCQYSTKVCEGIPCRNTGQCVPTAQGFKCLCPPNFTGKNCDIAVNLCYPNPCSNVSQCLSTQDGPKCRCDFGGRGDRCEFSSIGFKPLSYMTFTRLSNTDDGAKDNISFHFATIERSALVLYTTDGNAQFIAVEIINGFLRFSFNAGNRAMRITSDAVVSDGVWHTVNAVRDGQVR